MPRVMKKQTSLEERVERLEERLRDLRLWQRETDPELEQFRQWPQQLQLLRTQVVTEFERLERPARRPGMKLK